MDCYSELADWSLTETVEFVHIQAFSKQSYAPY